MKRLFERHPRAILLTAIALIVVFFISTIGFDLQKLAPDSPVALLEELQRHYPDKNIEEQLANKYWAKYRGVRTDKFFGQFGPLGPWGAREHYLRHGKFENREWPEEPKQPR